MKIRWSESILSQVNQFNLLTIKLLLGNFKVIVLSSNFFLNLIYNNCDPICEDRIVIPYSTEQWDIFNVEVVWILNIYKYLLQRNLEFQEGYKLQIIYVTLIMEIILVQNKLRIVIMMEICNLLIIALFVNKDYAGSNCLMDMSLVRTIIILIVDHYCILQIPRRLFLIQNQCLDFNQYGLLQEQEQCDDGSDYQLMIACVQLNQTGIAILYQENLQANECLQNPPYLIINYFNITLNKQYISIQSNQISTIILF